MSLTIYLILIVLVGLTFSIFVHVKSDRNNYISIFACLILLIILLVPEVFPSLGKVLMNYLVIGFALLIGGTYLAWRLTKNLYQKFYRMADQHGRASLFESIVKEHNYTQPRDLERAYQEAIKGKNSFE